MMEICPAGPPKLISPSLSQNQKACSRLTGSTPASAGAMRSFIAGWFLHEGGQQAIEQAAGGVKQLVVIGEGFAQPGQHPLDAGGLHRLGAAALQVMHPGGGAPPARGGA